MHDSIASQPWRDSEFAGDPRKSKLTGTTDGRTLKVLWDGGGLVVDLYASVNPRQVGPARFRRGTLILTMRKMRAAETWPSFEREEVQYTRAVVDRADDDAQHKCEWGGCFSCPA